MNRHDTSTWILLLINAALIVGVSIAALVGHYATPPPLPPPQPLRQVPNAHIATVFGHGPSPLEIQEIADLRAALGWVSGENGRLTRALAECQRKEIANGTDHASRLDGQSRTTHAVRSADSTFQPRLSPRDIIPTWNYVPTLSKNDEVVTQPPVQTAPGGGRTKDGADKNAIQMAKESGTSSLSARSTLTAPDCSKFATDPLSDGYVDRLGLHRYTRYRPEHDCYGAEASPYTAAEIIAGNTRSLGPPQPPRVSTSARPLRGLMNRPLQTIATCGGTYGDVWRPLGEFALEYTPADYCRWVLQRSDVAACREGARHWR